MLNLLRPVKGADREPGFDEADLDELFDLVGPAEAAADEDTACLLCDA